jgi:hypothetical protein
MKFNVAAKDPRVSACVGYGALGEAMQQFQSPGSALMEDTAKFWRACVSQEWSSVTGMIDAFTLINDYGSYEKIFFTDHAGYT